MTFKMNTDYRVLPNAYCCGRADEKTGFDAGDIVRLRELRIDNDNDARVRRVSDEKWGYINARYLEEVITAAPLTVGSRVVANRAYQFDGDTWTEFVGMSGEITDMRDRLNTREFGPGKIVSIRFDNGVTRVGYLGNLEPAPAAPAKIPGIFAVGDRVVYKSENEPFHQSNGRAGVVTRVYGRQSSVTWDDGRDLTDTPWLRNLVHESLDAKASVAPAPQYAEFSEYWKVGNEIQFTVNGSITDRVTVGCKNPLLSDVLPSLVSVDKVAGTATFKATIKPRGGISDTGMISEHGVQILSVDAQEYFKNVVITKAAPTRENVTVELTVAEQDALWHLLNEMQTGSTFDGLKAKLPAEAAQSPRRRLRMSGDNVGAKRISMYRPTS